MTTFALIPGAGGSAWYWHRVAPLLTSRGHRAVAVDLPGDDESAGLPEYTGLVLDAVRGRDDVVVVAQSLGGFTAPLVAARTPVRGVVLVNAMVPAPGETPGDWWGNTGAEDARTATARAAGYTTEFDPSVYFLHDLPRQVAADGEAHQRAEGPAVFASTCDLDAWPDVPTRVAAGADDRFFPVDFQRRVARERLGVEADTLPGGHLLALSQPQALVDYLLAG
ncbi:alpha/beta fold hydrolase [Parafrankia discariae]|uniref:alpha/beta fold hydrolase n=1 Tax=Parafrankia discariae TaxID=365528 RepID=UPI0003753FB2|nr:alpha/beta fold hydrolase [Parafrankia discariae]